MKAIKGLAIGVASFAALAMAGYVSADGNERPDIGKREYMNKCAVCHGQSGKGDGGAIDILKRAPSDLTVLSKNRYVAAIVDSQTKG